MSYSSKRSQKKGNTNYWPAQISAIAFVVFMFALIGDDFVKTLSYHPVLYNFFIGTIILAMNILFWKNPKRVNGFYFIAVGIIYYFLMWNTILAVSVIATAVWLILTGILYLLAPIKREIVPEDKTKTIRGEITPRVSRRIR